MQPQTTRELLNQFLPAGTSANSNPYADIVLTEAEKAEALRKGREAKHYEAKQAAYFEKINKPIVYPEYTAEQYYDLLAKRAEKMDVDFKIDEQNKEIIQALCYYFAGDEAFEGMHANWSLDKGLLLYGNVGCGKTTIMRLFTDNQQASYRIYSAEHISEQYSKLGVEGVAGFRGEITAFSALVNPFGHRTFGLCIDDLGVDINRKHFGNESNVIGELLQARYNSLSILRGKTHITTNLTAAEMEGLYGNRVTSRMREMFNTLAFPNAAIDRRK